MHSNLVIHPIYIYIYIYIVRNLTSKSDVTYSKLYLSLSLSLRLHMHIYIFLKHLGAKPHVRRHPTNTPKQYRTLVIRGGMKTLAVQGILTVVFWDLWF